MRFTKSLGALAGLALAGVLVAPAATAAAASPYPTYLQICTSAPTPPGHYVVSVTQTPLAGCPNTYGVPNTPGYSKLVAPVPNPPARFVDCLARDGFRAEPGYAVTAINNEGPCGYYVAPVTPGHTIVQTPLTGRRMDVCVLGGIPAGYKRVPGSARGSNGACGRYAAPASNDMVTIAPRRRAAG